MLLIAVSILLHNWHVFTIAKPDNQE